MVLKITDTRGRRIANSINEPDYDVLNWDTPTRDQPNIEPCSSYVSLASAFLTTSYSWQILSTLISDHLPIFIILQMKPTTNPGLRQNYVNLKKVDWDRYRQDLEAALNKRSLPTDTKEMGSSSVQFYSKQRHTTSLLDDKDSIRNLKQ